MTFHQPQTQDPPETQFLRGIPSVMQSPREASSFLNIIGKLLWPSPAQYEERSSDRQKRAVENWRLGITRSFWYQVVSVHFPGVPRPYSTQISASDTISVQMIVKFLHWYRPSRWWLPCDIL